MVPQTPFPSFRLKAWPRPDRGPDSITAGATCGARTEPFAMDPFFHRADGDGSARRTSWPATPSGVPMLAQSGSAGMTGAFAASRRRPHAPPQA